MLTVHSGEQTHRVLRFLGLESDGGEITQMITQINDVLIPTRGEKKKPWGFPSLKTYFLPKIKGFCLEPKVYFPIEAIIRRVLIKSQQVLFNLNIANFVSLFLWETVFSIVQL